MWDVAHGGDVGENQGGNLLVLGPGSRCRGLLPITMLPIPKETSCCNAFNMGGRPHSRRRLANCLVQHAVIAINSCLPSSRRPGCGPRPYPGSRRWLTGISMASSLHHAILKHHLPRLSHRRDAHMVPNRARPRHSTTAIYSSPAPWLAGRR